MRFGLRFLPSKAPKAKRPAVPHQLTIAPEDQCSGFAKSKNSKCTRRATHDGRCSQHPRRREQALTASVSTVRMDAAGWQEWKFGARAWQAEAWRLYDIVGPLRFVANWIGNSVSRCRLYVAEVNENGEPADEVKDPEVAQLAGGFLGQGPAKDEALRLLGICLFVAGEGYIVAEADAADGGGDRWFVVSGRHITRKGQQIVIRRSQINGGGDMVYREGVDLIIRVWTPHPDDADEPDSSARSAIPELRKIEVIGKRVFAELDSRLAGAGVLLLPDNIDFAPPPVEPGKEPLQANASSFSVLLQRTMATSLQDRSSAEAMVPLVATVPADSVDKIKHLTFWTEISNQLIPLADAAYRALGMSLDIPPEILQGQADSNHWSAWQTSDDAITTQIKPVLSRIADGGTSGYLFAALEELGKDSTKHVFNFDAAPLATRPNRVADALKFYDEGLISGDTAVREGAFTDDDRPDENEKQKRFAERAVQGAPTLIQDPALRELLGLPPLPPISAPGVVPPAPPAQPANPAPEPAPVKDPQSPPEETPQTEETAALVAVSKLAMHRAMALAGGRLVPRQQRDRYKGVDRHQLHTRCSGVSRSRADELLRGAWTDLPTVAEDLYVDAAAYETLLHDFAADLLTRGIAYDPADLRDLIVAEMRGHGLTAMAGVTR